MCTVTYIPSTRNCGFILTSNRDEKAFRPTIAPSVYEDGDLSVSYPKDVQAGGSWIAMNNNGRLCCLLNGAYEKHYKQDYHTHSRGKVLLKLASSVVIVEDFFAHESLANVEPFIIITIEQSEDMKIKLHESIWDGENVQSRILDNEQYYLWSSVTLYDEENREIRKQWFHDFIKEYAERINPENIFDFHSGTHTTDVAENLVMEREGGLKTVSITQVTACGAGLKMSYTDLLNSSKHNIEL